MYDNLTVEDLLAPACGRVEALSTRADEIVQGRGPLKYSFLTGEITRERVLVVPQLDRYARCWYCHMSTHGRWLKRDRRGFILDIEVACKLCSNLRDKGREGDDLVRVLGLIFARWMSKPSYYAAQLKKWQGPVSWYAQLPEHRSIERQRHEANLELMRRARAAEIAAMCAATWPARPGWILTAREAAAQEAARRAALLDSIRAQVGEDEVA